MFGLFGSYAFNILERLLCLYPAVIFIEKKKIQISMKKLALDKLWFWLILINSMHI